ncbi:hypothetical protein [Parendozoicomonas haliclonae]|uniref:Uncharacterized protein n=1 Tax=Parendozoicomonas haliclonae TaxID=1960125 RepID=A0A1X7APQ6_9GAMM|nr:hypothetical protein [Parendozoicomonas haliclonae]SMA49309.1 hypothetical protein EHSB41UT_03172 [Parendozoicomonas haliclonae]
MQNKQYCSASRKLWRAISSFSISLLAAAHIGLAQAESETTPELPHQEQEQPEKWAFGGIQIKNWKLEDKHAITLSLRSPTGIHSILAPLDSEHRPECSHLFHQARKAFESSQSSANTHYHCSNNFIHRIGSDATLVYEGDRWHVHELHWHNGWRTLSMRFADTPLSPPSMYHLFDLQGQLLDMSTRNGLLYKGLGIHPEPLPVALWEWLAGSYKSLGNLTLAAWHSGELGIHTAGALHYLNHRDWSHLGLNLLSMLIHGLESLEHLDHAGVGNHIHLDFHGDIIEASPYPHATSISWASAALILDIIERLHEHGHHEHVHSARGQIMALVETLHTGLHIYELAEALSDWINGNPAHDHSEHDHGHEAILNEITD